MQQDLGQIACKLRQQHISYTLFYYKTLETEACGILSYRRSQYENEKATPFPPLSVWTGHSWPGWHHHGSGGWSHHWGPWHHWHVSTHRWPHPWSRSNGHHSWWGWAHHWHHWWSTHMRGWHHARPRGARDAGRRWYHGSCGRWCRERCRWDFPLLECSRCFVNQALSLLLHPFLIIVFHILFVFSATAVGFSHRGRVVGEVRVTVITVKLRHAAPRRRHREVTRSHSDTFRRLSSGGSRRRTTAGQGQDRAACNAVTSARGRAQAGGAFP